MKRKVIALFAGLVSFLIISIFLAPLDKMISPISEESTTLVFSFLIAGGITGFLVRKCGHIYGGLMAVLPYLISALLFVAFGTYLWAQTNFQQVIYQDDPKSTFFIDTLQIITRSVLLAGVGGFIGEKVYNLLNKK